MVRHHRATGTAERRADGHTRIRRYETGRSGHDGPFRALVPATITALLVALLVASAIGQARTASPAAPTAGAAHAVARPADTFDWEQYERTGAPRYRPADTFDWEQWERTGSARYQPADTFDWEQYERTR